MIGVFLAATAAYAFSRYRFPGYRPALTSFLIAQMFPAAILIVPIYNIILHLGLLNQKLGLVLAYCTTAVPFCVWMLKGYFDTIPISLEEAGRIDGLTPFGTFWRIVIPLSLPGPRGDVLLLVHHRLERGRLRERPARLGQVVHAAGRDADVRLPVRAELGEDDRRRGARHPPGASSSSSSRSATSSAGSPAAGSRDNRAGRYRALPHNRVPRECWSGVRDELCESERQILTAVITLSSHHDGAEP